MQVEKSFTLSGFLLPSCAFDYLHYVFDKVLSNSHVLSSTHHLPLSNHLTLFSSQLSKHHKKWWLENRTSNAK